MNILEYSLEHGAYFDDDVILSSIASIMAADGKIEEFIHIAMLAGIL